MKHFARTCRILDERRERVLSELHPELWVRVMRVLVDLDGRLAPWEGYRSHDEQARLLAAGTTNAGPGDSPHNHRPALACDLVLDPRHVEVAPHPDDPSVPNLWDYESPSALATWEALERACERHELERISIRVRGKLVRDRPHVQLPGWRAFART